MSDTRATPKEKARFWAKVDMLGPDECWLWNARKTKTGYGQFSRKRKPKLAHRVAYELAVGPIPAGLHVLHSCDNPPCCNPAHLHSGTNADNMREKCERGRHKRSNSSGKPRALTPDDVRAIRAVQGYRGVNEEHARRLGVSSATVWAAAVGLTYRDV